MLTIEYTQTFGWEAALRGMRNPKNSWDRLDSTVDYARTGEVFPTIGPNDMLLAKTLIKSGSVHRKFLRMINVQCDIIAPLYWWKEFDTYKVGTVANSCSTMHKVMSKKFVFEDFAYEDILDVIDMMNTDFRDNSKTESLTPYTVNDSWVKTLHALNSLRLEYLHEKDPVLKKRYWKCLIQMLPTNFLQRRTVQLNYEVLRSMMQPDCRLHHKLTEWSVNFVDWVRTLPYAEEFIFQEEVTDEKND